MPSAQEKVNRWYGANGQPLEIRYYPEAASQSATKRGDLVYLSSGKVTVACAAGANPTTEQILGILEADCTGTTDTMLPVAIANANLRWVLPVTHATAASAITAVTQVGTNYDVERTAAGKWAVAIDDTGNPKATVQSICPQYAVGEQYGWVEVAFIQAEVDVRD